MAASKAVGKSSRESRELLDDEEDMPWPVNESYLNTIKYIIIIITPHASHENHPSSNWRQLGFLP